MKPWQLSLEDQDIVNPKSDMFKAPLPVCPIQILVTIFYWKYCLQDLSAAKIAEIEKLKEKLTGEKPKVLLLFPPASSPSCFFSLLLLLPPAPTLLTCEGTNVS